MDGDFAKLDGLVRLKKKYGCLLAIDEAHATLVCGKGGAGAASMYGVEDDVDVHVGTLSKAIGSQGGFIACSRAMKQYLVNKGRGLVYSTSLPLPSVASAQAGILVGCREEWRREHLHAVVKRFKKAWNMPLHITPTSPIVPLIVGTEEKTMSVSGQLLESYRFHVPGIRPPTVPTGTSRLRISFSASHTTEMVDSLIDATRALLCPADSLPAVAAGTIQVRDRNRLSKL